MLFAVDFKLGKPVYLQIVDQAKAAAASGALQPGEPLPSIRPVAEQLRVNRNTIAKAYAELEKQGVIDPDQIAIGGWSYGGYLSAWASGHAGPFKTAIVGAGMTDLTSMALTTDIGYSFIPSYFGDPVRERARYAAHSPLTYVHDVHMPVLIMHGEHDARVPVFQGEMFYNALRQQGTPVEMVRYPGAPHWFGGAVGPAYEEDVQQRVLDWLGRYLGPRHDAVAPAKTSAVSSTGGIPLDTGVPH